jgi:hypothetical protein
MKPGVKEELTKLLLQEMSRRNTDVVVDLLNKEPTFFTDLMELYLANVEPVSRRAAWAIDIFTELQPDYLNGWTEKMINQLEKFGHDGLRRHTLRMVSRTDFLSTSNLGLLTKVCFDWLTAAKTPVAIKVYCMDILYRLSEAEPDLGRELADTIEWRMDEESPGFRSHGQKILIRLHLKDQY